MNTGLTFGGFQSSGRLPEGRSDGRRGRPDALVLGPERSVGVSDSLADHAHLWRQLAPLGQAWTEQSLKTRRHEVNQPDGVRLNPSAVPCRLLKSMDRDEESFAEGTLAMRGFTPDEAPLRGLLADATGEKEAMLTPWTAPAGHQVHADFTWRQVCDNV